MKTLLVVGAGPKAMALAAKAAVLRDLDWDAPRVVVLEKGDVAAHWDGSSGYTDGQRRLETPPEKDVGFPYLSELRSQVGLDIDQRMLRFSWTSFLVESGKYGGWIDEGRPEPSHEGLATYFKWVGMSCGATIVRARVTRITRTRGLWRVTCRSGSKVKSFDGDGLVMCGPGFPWTLKGQPTTHPRVFDGRDFWSRLSEWDRIFRRVRNGDEISVAVVGSGGTAATIVAELVARRDGRPVNVFVVNRDATIFTRGESFHETRLFTDPSSSDLSSWQSLPAARRKEFVQRLDRGVVWHKSAPILAKASYEHMDVAEMEATNDRVWLVPKSGRVRGFDYVIVAMGFDGRWFRSLLPKVLAKKFGAERKIPAIGEDLAARGIRPRLHVPMLASQAQGPGFPSLRSLGRLSDRILRPYLRPPRRA